ncbi:hypothetical protein Fot_44504 [Forsythia ovata]|uniref:Uncharacterized protein n=1 Tax=Forsythia ovata TaxID=205694 RepID=A0ABD1R3P9_9LAMI
MNWDGDDVSFGDQGQRTAEEVDDREVDTGVNGTEQKSVEESVDACAETTVESEVYAAVRTEVRVDHVDGEAETPIYTEIGTTMESDQEEEAVDTCEDTTVEGEAEATVDTGIGTTVEGNTKEADQPRRQDYAICQTKRCTRKT